MFTLLYVPVRLRLGPPRWVVAFVANDQLDFGQAHAGTCGHDRQTAATRCAEVRSPKRPAVPPKVAGQTSVCIVWSGHSPP